jgi:hypothetical protein
MNLLADRVTAHLRKIVGLALVDVSLFCFKCDIDPVSVENYDFYIGGEVFLNFGSEIAIVTWDENAGWEDHFSVYLGCNSFLSPTASVINWNVSDLSPWKICIGQKLIAAQVYGDHQTPHVVGFDFGNISIFIGDGREHQFGDGDDVVINTNLYANNDLPWNKMWDSSDEILS